MEDKNVQHFIKEFGLVEVRKEEESIAPLWLILSYVFLLLDCIAYFIAAI